MASRAKKPAAGSRTKATSSRSTGRAGGGNSKGNGAAFSEKGVSGTAIFGGYIATHESHPKAVGQTRYVAATEMLANVSIVAASVRYFLNLVGKAAWKVNPADDTPAAQEAAEFMEEILYDMVTSWSRIVRRGGMYRFHGFSWQEWTAKVRRDGRIGLQDIETRPQKTIQRWAQDQNGSIVGVYQRSPMTGQEIPLPRWKAIYLVDDMMTDSPEGMGWFRHLLEPSERLGDLLKLEVIGFERDLSGTPIGKAPFTRLKRDVKAGTITQEEANQQLEALRATIKAQVRKKNTGMILDSLPYEDQTADGKKNSAASQWGLDLLTGKSETISDLNVAIERINREMARIMGTEGLMLGGDGAGSMALSENKSDNLSLHVNSTLVDMAEFLTRDLVDPIWTLNGLSEDLKPELRTEDVAFRDVQDVTKALLDMANAGAVLTPDDPAIDDVRDLLGISPRPPVSEKEMGGLNDDEVDDEDKARAEQLAQDLEDGKITDEELAKRLLEGRNA